MSECVTKTEITPSVKRRGGYAIYRSVCIWAEHYRNPAGTGILNEKYQQYGTSAVQLCRRSYICS